MSENNGKLVGGKKRRLIGLILKIALALGLVGAVALGFTLLSFGSYDDEKLHGDAQTTLIYDADANAALRVHGAQNREKISLDDIPRNLINAFLAAEDLRFYKHVGFDIVRIAGALLVDIRTGTLSQGASTITQQLIKNTHLTPEKTWSRKLREAYYAFLVERDYTKDEILEMYMNHVYLGNGAYGVQAAALAYFGKDVTGLSLTECASLAAILKAPSNYAPHIAPENNKKRRDMILSTMLNERMVSKGEYDRAVSGDVYVIENAAGGGHGWFTDAALEEARAILGIDYEELLAGGYRIYSSQDTQLQLALEELFTDPSLFPPNAPDGTLAQAAVAVTDVETGAIRALIGGREYETRRGLNRATQARRQPGSTLKPFAVYSPAIERYGYTGVSVLDDYPIDIDGYAPGNYGGVYRGAVTLREAVARSINVPAVEVLYDIGVETGKESVSRFGIPVDANDGYLPLALGSMTYGATPLEMCGAYAALGNGGYYIQTYTVLSIRDMDGNIVYERKPTVTQAVSEPAAAVMTDILRSAAGWGTASKLAGTGLDVAAKTGTVAFEGDKNRDAWTVAYTPRTCVAVWMGFDITDAEHALPKEVTGGGLPAGLAALALGLAQEDNIPFGECLGTVRVALDKKALEESFTALLATDITPESERVSELFILGSEPTQFSEYWARARTPVDFTVGQGMGGFPEIRFTVLDEHVRYKLFRVSGAGEVHVCNFNGTKGETVIYTDPSAKRSETYAYYIIPEHAVAADLGVLADGEPTARRTYSVPALLFGQQREAEITSFPKGTPETFFSTPTPGQTPDSVQNTPEDSRPPSATPASIATPKPTPSGPMFGGYY